MSEDEERETGKSEIIKGMKNDQGIEIVVMGTIGTTTDSVAHAVQSLTRWGTDMTTEPKSDQANADEALHNPHPDAIPNPPAVPLKL